MNATQRNEYWQVFNRFQMRREKLYAPKIAKVLEQQKREFIEQYKQGKSAIMLDPTPIRNLLRTLYTDAAVNFGSLVLARLKQQKRRMPIGFNAAMQALIEQYYGVDFLNMSEGLSDTTREMLQRVLIEAQRAGRGFDDIVAELEGTDISRQRARLIARTETVTAANFGAHQGAKLSGILVKKVWIATQDSRTRDSHFSVSKEAIDMDEPFKVGGELMLHPGARVQTNGLRVSVKNVANCRCVEAHQPVRDSLGRVISTN